MIIPSTVITFLFLILLIFIGILTSYSDIKYGKIRNTHLLTGLLYIFSLYLFLLYYSHFIIYQSGNFKYIAELIINGSIALLVGYLLWHFNLWAAGDAKLVAIYALTVPLNYYSKNYISYFPAASLLLDTFLFICLTFFLKIIYTFIIFCFRSFKKGKPLTLLFSKKNYKIIKRTIIDTGKMLLIFTCFFLTTQYLMLKINTAFQIQLFNFLPAYILFFVIQIMILKKLTKNIFLIIFIILAGLLSSIALITSNQTNILISTIKSSVIFILFLNLGARLIYLYIDNREIKNIKPQELRPGDFLAPQSLFKLKNKLKTKIKINNFGLIRADGLTKDQVIKAKKIFKDNLKKELYICRTFPFAPFMFAASIFTVLAKKSFLSFLLAFFSLA